MPASSSGSEATPPPAPSSAARPRAYTGRLALAFALIAAACSWNALAAPFALLTALGALVLAVRAWRRGAPRRTAAAALAVAVLGAAVAAVVLAAATGVGPSPQGALGIDSRSPAEVRRALDDAAARSKAARERAAAELERLAPSAGGAPQDVAGGAPPAR